ncbi:MAG: antibiotic biosynthesis monooxygenase [Actinomycetota bacterium]|nr:antibiotic biosynthesis monooxygenase [Actinomycetota bacterium]
MEVYTLGVWRVREGKESEFVEAWRRLGGYFRNLPNPPGPGTLVQSVDDPRLFYSFGPWRSLDDIAMMRSAPDTPGALARLAALCDEAKPGTFRVVARVEGGLEAGYTGEAHPSSG